MQRGMVIDAHTHPVGPRMDKGTVSNYGEQTVEFGNKVEPGRIEKMMELMDKNHVDKAIGTAAIGLTAASDLNERIIQVARDHGDKFPAVMIGFNVPDDPNDFNGETAANEVDSLLDLPEVKGIGEWSLTAGAGMEDWPSLWAKYRPILDVVADHKKAILFHTGTAPYTKPLPRPATRNRAGNTSRRRLWFYNPMFVDDIACEYPEVPLIIGHMGVQGFFYFGTYADMALMTAAKNPNVYLETSSVPFEVLERAVCDPAIGPEKLLFGTDTPAPYSYYKYKGEFYPSYGKSPCKFYVDHCKYDLANIERLSIPDREKELILGGNISRILGL
jgi:predicted TIM-barrel fold metal-dependent hydrolase